MSLTEMQQPRRTAHTLFVDFVGYSRLSADSQAAVQVALQNLIYNLPAFQAARAESELMVRKTGDGMAVIFFKDIEFPLAAAIALDEVLKRQTVTLREQIGANFRLRMGIHSGPVIIVDEDGDGLMDVAGEGINIAQRVMDCGEEGHILASGAVANLIEELPHWKSLFHDLGIVRVKHDELVHLYNIYGTRPDSTTIGYEALPRRVHESHERARQQVERNAALEQSDQKTFVMGYALRAALLIGSIVVLAGLLWSFWNYRAKPDMDKVARDIREIQAEKQKKNRPSPPPSITTLATPVPAPSPSTLAEREIPNLVGLTREEAQKALAPLGLTLTLSSNTPAAPSPTIPAGSVVTQFPAPGRQVVTEGAIYVTLSSGPATPPAGEVAYTGVLIDARRFLQLGSAQKVGLFGPNSALLYTPMGITNDLIEAVQTVGENPLRLDAVQAGPSGVAISAADVETLRGLTDVVRSKTVVLRP